MSTTDSTPTRPADVLLVEDNEVDVMFTRRAFAKANLTMNLHHVENGEECLKFLRKQGDYADAPTPDLILLDLNMPIMDGRETLTEIVKDDKLNTLPVVILTTAADEKSVLEMYDLRCSSYIVKPVDFGQFQRVINELGEYWFNIVLLPKTDSPSN